MDGAGVDAGRKAMLTVTPRYPAPTSAFDAPLLDVGRFRTVPPTGGADAGGGETAEDAEEDRDSPAQPGG